MHALVTAIGSVGNALPFIGWGAALQRRGHRVTVLGNPHVQSAADAEGLEFVPIGADETAQLQARSKGLALLWQFRKDPPRLARAIVHAVERHHTPGESVLAGPSWMFGARIAAEKFRLPLATVYLQPLFMLSAHDPGLLGGNRLPQPWQAWIKSTGIRLVDRTLRPGLNQLRQELGLPPVQQVLRGWAPSPDLIVCFFPEWYAGRKPDWPPQAMHAGFPLYDTLHGPRLDLEVDQFLSAGDPPLLFSQSTRQGSGQKFVQTSLEVARQLGRRAILLASEPPAAAETRDVLHLPFAPLSLLLPRVSAFVHHGGIGSLSQALRFGVPQLTVPQTLDQPDNSRRLAELGVSHNLSPRQYRPAVVRDILERLVSSSDVQERCQHWAQAIAGTPPFAAACDALERLHAHGGPTP
jgi:UDP:flavonoid glycosyltransferase YjiC (YdhE family)